MIKSNIRETKHEMLVVLLDTADHMTGDCFKKWRESIPEGEPSADQLKEIFNGFVDCMKQEGIW